MRVPILAVVLAGCGNPDVPENIAIGQTCRSHCGMSGFGVESCTEFQRAEDTVLQAYKPLFDIERACIALDGVSVYKTDLFEVVPGIIGRYYFKSKTIVLTKLPLKDNSFPHEVGHALESEVNELYGHEEWEARGFLKSIKTYKEAMN